MGVQSGVLPPHRRAAIEAEIEVHLQRATLLIARLDRADAPSEDMEDDDPDHEHDGSEPEHRIAPLFGVDQSTGPTNRGQAEREHFIRERGLVRSSTGGWRHPS